MNAIPAYCVYVYIPVVMVRMNAILPTVCIIPVAMVRMNAIPAYCVYVLYLWEW